jgi:hypothetical protein
MSTMNELTSFLNREKAVAATPSAAPPNTNGQVVPSDAIEQSA